MEGENTPRPEGFQTVVCKKCWCFMKNEFMAVVRELHDNGYLKWKLNNTLSLSFLKKGGKSIGDFSTISLLSGGYKIIVEVLALRMKSVINKPVSEFQIVGVEGRQNHENVLIANGLLDSRLKS